MIILTIVCQLSFYSVRNIIIFSFINPQTQLHTSHSLSLTPFPLLSLSMAVRTLLSRKTLASVLLRNDIGAGGMAAAAAAGAAQTHSRGIHALTLPDLGYDYGALEPVISGEIMQIHHQKHHQTYITNYNKALEQLQDAIAKSDSSAVVKLQSAIKFNGGGLPSLYFFFHF